MYNTSVTYFLEPGVEPNPNQGLCLDYQHGEYYLQSFCRREFASKFGATDEAPESSGT